MELADETLIVVAAIPANFTELTVVKPEPVIVILAPTCPLVGVKEDKDGFCPNKAKLVETTNANTPKYFTNKFDFFIGFDIDCA